MARRLLFIWVKGGGGELPMSSSAVLILILPLRVGSLLFTDADVLHTLPWRAQSCKSAVHFQETHRVRNFYQFFLGGMS